MSQDIGIEYLSVDYATVASSHNFGFGKRLDIGSVTLARGTFAPNAGVGGIFRVGCRRRDDGAGPIAIGRDRRALVGRGGAQEPRWVREPAMPSICALDRPRVREFETQ